MSRHKKSEHYWKQFVRIQQASECFDANSVEHIKLNRAGWEIISKYLDELLGEAWDEK